MDEIIFVSVVDVVRSSFLELVNRLSLSTGNDPIVEVVNSPSCVGYFSDAEGVYPVIFPDSVFVSGNAENDGVLVSSSETVCASSYVVWEDSEVVGASMLENVDEEASLVLSYSVTIVFSEDGK